MLRPLQPRLFLRLACIAACIGVATPASADPKADWPEGSAMHTGYLHLEKRDAFARLLERRQAELLALVEQGSGDARLVQALRAQHEAWLAYRTHECELIGALTGAGGSWPSTYAVQCEANLTDRRYRRVHAALRCIRRIPADDRAFEQSRCLQQLAPLVNPN